MNHPFQVAKRISLLIPVMFLLSWNSDAYGQWLEKWMAVGDYAQVYAEADGRVQDGTGSLWPFIRGTAGDHHHSQALWIAVKNFTDEEGTEWSAKVAHSGPRVNGIGEVFPTRFRMVSRFEDPEVTVDGLPTFQVPTRIDAVDPTLKADRVIYNSLNSVTGVTMEREVRAFSQEYHDDYHIWEYTFTNTGNVDGDEEIELPDQTLEDVFFIFMKRWRGPDAANDVIGGGAGYGFHFMEDQVGDGVHDEDIDLRAQFVWQGNVPNFNQWDPIGAPAIRISGGGGPELPPADTTGRLVLDEFMGRAYIHADKSATDTTDDPSQPSAMKWHWADNWLSSGQDHLNPVLNQREYEFFAEGHSYPHHAEVVEPHGDFAHPTGKPALDSPGGHKNSVGFGPYTLEPGQSVHLVIVEGIAGLEQEEATVAIGNAYKRLWGAGDQYGDIEYDADGDGQIEPDEVMDKNEWVMTSRDSLFQVFRRARANYQSGYDIPKPPLPPSEFHVTSGVDEVTLEWNTFPDADPEGFEIYRTRNRFQGAVEDGYSYELVHEAGPEERSYRDTDVVRGIDYYYYIQAVGEVNQDPTGLTPTGKPLKSSRYYTQTYSPASLKRGPGEALADARVVPNPYHLSSDQNVRWPDQQDKIGFLNIPGQATIKIYTERGDLIETIDHADGSGDAYWNLTTSSNQVVVSGLYVALIQDGETGAQIIRKFVIIR